MIEHLPILGSTKRLVHAGMALHRLPDAIVMAGLEQHLRSLYPKGWYACVLFQDGRGTMRGVEDRTPAPAKDVMERIYDVAVKINREIHHDGHWVVVWAGSRMSLLWRDADGDAQFTVELDEPWVRVSTWSVIEIGERAEAGYAGWVERMRAADIRREHTIKAAQGETSRGPFPTLH